MFQSLFQWILLSNRSLYIHTCPSTNVSILVLVDLAFEFLPAWSYPAMTENVSILVLVDLAFEFLVVNEYIAVPVLFQSLFQWILLSNDYAYHMPLSNTKFQSLFQWILLSNTYKNCRRLSLMQVSILVLVDLAFEFMFMATCLLLESLFQSLFQWILLSNDLSKDG